MPYSPWGCQESDMAEQLLCEAATRVQHRSGLREAGSTFSGGDRSEQAWGAGGGSGVKDSRSGREGSMTRPPQTLHQMTFLQFVNVS